MVEHTSSPDVAANHPEQAACEATALVSRRGSVLGAYQACV
jgi:hypothetical protein